MVKMSCACAIERMRCSTAILADGRSRALRIVCGDRVNRRERVFDAVVQLVEKEPLLFLGLL
jgi:hypothetical protein